MVVLYLISAFMIFLVLLIAEIGVLYLLKRKTSQRIFNFFYRITRSRKTATYLFAILFLPGTFVHEMSHFLTALFLLVPVGQIELMPQVEENSTEKGQFSVRMGSVPIGKCDPIRRTLIGVAPIIFGLSIILGSIFYIYTRNLFTPLVLTILVYIVFEVGNSMFSSKKDLEGSLIVAIMIVIIYLILYFLGVRVNLNINEEIFKTADIYLLVPIGIDLLFVLI